MPCVAKSGGFGRAEWAGSGPKRKFRRAAISAHKASVRRYDHMEWNELRAPVSALTVKPVCGLCKGQEVLHCVKF